MLELIGMITISLVIGKIVISEVDAYIERREIRKLKKDCAKGEEVLARMQKKLDERNGH